MVWRGSYNYEIINSILLPALHDEKVINRPIRAI